MVEQGISAATPRRGPGRPPTIKPAASELNASASVATSSPAFVSMESSPEFVPEAPRPSPEHAPETPRPIRARRPFGSQNQKLARPERPGYVRRWFNDVPGRLIRAKEAGWEFVNKNASAENDWRGDGERESMPVGVTEAGGAMIAFLMECPEEWYKEDMAVEQARIDEVEKAIRRGVDDGGTPGRDGRYLPHGENKIIHGRG